MPAIKGRGSVFFEKSSAGNTQYFGQIFGGGKISSTDSVIQTLHNLIIGNGIPLTNRIVTQFHICNNPLITGWVQKNGPPIVSKYELFLKFPNTF